MLIFGCRFILSELEKTSSHCDVDDSVDDVSLPQKLDVAALSNITPDSATVNKLQRDEDSQYTFVSGPKGGILCLVCY